MTSIVQEIPQTRSEVVLPPHVLIVGKKFAVHYLAPALFRLGNTGELLIRAKGSLSIVTAVNVAELVKRDVSDIKTESISIGTEEMTIDGQTRRASFIEIHLSKQNAPAVEVKPKAKRKSAPKKRVSKKAAA